MTQREFALTLYNKLRKDHNPQEIADALQSATINGHPLSKQEQIKIVELIGQIHIEHSKGLFESVDAFLALVNNVENIVKVQNSASSESKGVKDSNGNG